MWLKCMLKSIGVASRVAMRCVIGVKMGWIQIKIGHPLAQNGVALAPFRAQWWLMIVSYS